MAGGTILASLPGMALLMLWLWFFFASALLDALYFTLYYAVTLVWDSRIGSFWVPVYMFQIFFLGRRELVPAISEFIKKRLYNGVGKIGWGYYKDLPQGTLPDDHSFNHIVELLSLDDGCVVVDVGCGHGWFSTNLASRFPRSQVYGLEVDPTCIAIAESSPKSAGNISWAVFRERFVEALPAAIKGNVDAIVVIGVVNELNNDQLNQLLQDIFEQLGCRGTAYVSFIERTQRHWDPLAMAFANYVAPSSVPKDQFLKACTDAGLLVDTLNNQTPHSCEPHFKHNKSRSWEIFGPFAGAWYWLLLHRFISFVQQENLKSFNVVLRKPAASVPETNLKANSVNQICPIIEESMMLIQRVLEFCREQWTGIQWDQHQVEEVLNEAGERFCSRLTSAVQLENIVPDARIVFKNGGFCFTSQKVNGAQKPLSGETLTVDRLVAHLASCCGQEPSQMVIMEVQSCIMNDTIATLFQRYVWHGRNVGNLWHLVYEEKQMDVHESLDLWESFAAFLGHPRHVMSKSKLELAPLMPLSPGNVCKFSPEFGQAVSLFLLAVRRDLMIAFPSAEEWQAFWLSHHPDALDLLAKEVGAEHIDEHLLLWVHPLNLENLQKLFPLHFHEGSLRILSRSVVLGQPTLSFRTLAMAQDYHAKLPVPLQMTSWPRYVSPVEIQESAVISRLWPRLDLPTKLVMLMESRSCHLSYEFTGGVASYEHARYCSMLVRDSPVPHVRHGHHLVPLAAAFSPTPAGRTLFEDMWEATGIGRDEIVRWFAEYVKIIAECQLTPLLRYGLTIEAHQQNGMIELTHDGWLARLFCRELGGGIEWDLERLEAFPDLNFVDQLYPRQDIFTSAETCRSLLRHTMLESHLLPLADICSSVYDLKPEDLREIIRSEVAAVIESIQPSPDDCWSSSQFHGYASSLKSTLLEEKTCTRKALLRMRLEGTKDYVFVEHRNRLAPVN